MHTCQQHVHQISVETLWYLAFLLDTGWPLFETTASSIFEHLFATLPQFGLRPFQRPLSVDIGDPLQAGAG